MDAVGRINDDNEAESDGSCESSFVIAVPLDGSLICGSELKEFLSNKQLLRNLMLMKQSSFFRRMGGDSSRIENGIQDLKQKIASSLV